MAYTSKYKGEDIDKKLDKVDFPKIEAVVVGDTLHIINAEFYIKNGYYPHIFRKTRRANKRGYHDFDTGDYDIRRQAPTRGWHEIGRGNYNVKISGTAVMFRDDFLDWWHNGVVPTTDYTYRPDIIVGNKDNRIVNGRQKVPWGKRLVPLRNRAGNYCMRKFDFAIGFGMWEQTIPMKKFTPTDCVSNLAEFSVVFTPRDKVFKYTAKK